MLGAVEDGLTPGAPLGLHGVAEAAATEPGVGEELDNQLRLAALHLQLGRSGGGDAVRPVSTGGQEEGGGDLLVENCQLRVLHLAGLAGHQVGYGRTGELILVLGLLSSQRPPAAVATTVRRKNNGQSRRSLSLSSGCRMAE